jgi:protein-disulfide isomerase
LAATAAVIPIEQEGLIVKDSGTAVLGVANPEVTVVEYFDYNCRHQPAGA